jgi:ribonuclease P protein component
MRTGTFYARSVRVCTGAPHASEHVRVGAAAVRSMARRTRSPVRSRDARPTTASASVGPPGTARTENEHPFGPSTWSTSEAHLPAEDPAPFPQARLPSPHVRSCRAGDHQGPPPQGPSPSVRLIDRWLIDRLGDREAFRRLRSEGRRHRSGPLSVVVRIGPERTRPALAFAIPRRVGPAVTRNRLRRRLRELYRELDRDGLVAAGDHLVMVDPSASSCDFPTLAEHVRRLNERVRDSVPGRTGMNR